MFKCQQDDPIIKDMDPVQYMWMYENWVADQNEKVDLAKNHAYLLASFWNPEAVNKILGQSGDTHISTDEEFEESTRMVKEMNENKDKGEDQKVIKTKKRRTIK